MGVNKCMRRWPDCKKENYSITRWGWGGRRNQFFSCLPDICLSSRFARQPLGPKLQKISVEAHLEGLALQLGEKNAWFWQKAKWQASTDVCHSSSSGKTSKQKTHKYNKQTYICNKQTNKDDKPQSTTQFVLKAFVSLILKDTFFCGFLTGLQCFFPV